MSNPRLGAPVEWTPASPPVPIELPGAHVRLRPLQPARDAPELFIATHLPHGDPELWSYLPYGPYADPSGLESALAGHAASADPLFFTITAPGANAAALGTCAYLRITPQHGTIEIGHLLFTRPLQRSTAATEAIFLLLRHAFDDLGYRRVEWKCNALNAPSRRAAERFGFRFEGVFAQHMVVKGRNRDTAWFGLTDARWPAVRAGYQAWLEPENFDEAGAQRRSLSDLLPV